MLQFWFRLRRDLTSGFLSQSSIRSRPSIHFSSFVKSRSNPRNWNQPVLEASSIHGSQCACSQTQKIIEDVYDSVYTYTLN